jgi:hypothetical protein
VIIGIDMLQLSMEKALKENMRKSLKVRWWLKRKVRTAPKTRQSVSIGMRVLCCSMKLSAEEQPWALSRYNWSHSLGKMDAVWINPLGIKISKRLFSTKSNRKLIDFYHQ